MGILPLSFVAHQLVLQLALERHLEVISEASVRPAGDEDALSGDPSAFFTGTAATHSLSGPAGFGVPGN